MINRYGFNSLGMDSFKTRLEAYVADPNRPRGVIGVNLGKNKNQLDAVGSIRETREKG